ncbi:MAG: transposase [Anaerolineae bacterium]|nr:transposase [Anaerolineae bacterium]
MPNHLHGIIIITDDERRGEAFPPDTFDGTTIARAEDTYASNGVLGNASPLPPRGVASRSLGAIIGNYKSVTARRINTIRHTSGAPVWQRNYWEHIIRDENEMNRIREYIINNPANWGTDNQNPARVSRRSR